MSKEMNRLSPDIRAILDRHLSERPVKLGRLARDLGISIKVSSLGTGISGQIAREGNGYIIRVNRNEARERQRFTIAHEISHFLLHRDIIDSSKDGIKDTVLYRSGAPNNIEYEANRLAADIVVPMSLLEQDIERDFEGVINESAIDSLARKYEVSKASMEIRLSNFAPA